jgi:hypothetical protein
MALKGRVELAPNANRGISAHFAAGFYLQQLPQLRRGGATAGP